MLGYASLAAETGGEHHPNLPATNDLIYGTLAFLLLYLLLAKLVFPRVNKLLDERAANIEGKLERAERDRRQAIALRDRYAEQLERAREEAASLVEEGRRRGEETRKEIIARAEQEAARTLRRAEDQIALERARAVGDVRRDVGQLAVELAGRIVGESMDGERQRRLVDRFIDQLEQPVPNGSRPTSGEGVRG